MSLCSFCLAVRSEELPLLPSDLDGVYLGRKKVFAFRTSRLEGPLGSPHQPNVKSILESAASCKLCSLMSESITGFLEDYREAQQNDSFWPRYKDEGIPVDSQLLLVGRRDGGDGFLILTYASSGMWAFLFGAIGFCADDDGPLAAFFPGRPVEDNPSYEKAQSRAASWLKNCVEKHEHCELTGDDISSLPTRVLDLGSSPTSRDVRLRDTKGAQGRYAALSHCWGHSGHFTTTLASIEARKERIRLEQLPKTFRDAIAICRRLSTRYLWIDSLCICQDDAQDWERESAAMTAVYSNSYFTIAATGAKSNADGCFIRRSKRKHVPIHFTTDNGIAGELLAFHLPQHKAVYSRHYVEMRDEPLTKRAWALQERMMPRRVIHFCTDQVYYECNAGFCGEDGIRIQGRYNSLFPGPLPGFHPISRQSRVSAAHSLWNLLLEDYTSRQVTKVSDRFPALSGLVGTFAKRIGAEYLAGLWSNALLEGLNWQGIGPGSWHMPAASAVYVAPSWSWASYCGTVGTFGFDWTDVATVIDHNISLKNAENPYGEVTDGWIVIRAPLIPLSVCEMPAKNGMPGRWWMRLKTPWGNPAGFSTAFDTFDEDPEHLAVSLAPIFALVLQQKVGIDDGGRCYRGLIVAAKGGEDRRMRRLGWTVDINADVIGNRQIIEDSSSFATITLI